MNEHVRISIKITAWRRPGDKPLSEPMVVNLLTHICVTRPQWVKEQCPWPCPAYWKRTGITSLIGNCNKYHWNINNFKTDRICANRNHTQDAMQAAEEMGARRIYMIELTRIECCLQNNVKSSHNSWNWKWNNQMLIYMITSSVNRDVNVTVSPRCVLSGLTSNDPG